jgi:unsaturated chondroitin disaccharide hydrolase
VNVLATISTDLVAKNRCFNPPLVHTISIFMNRYVPIVLIFFWFLSSSCSAQPKPVDVPSAIVAAAKQYEKMLAAQKSTEFIPFTLNPDGSPKNRKSDWWTSGFFGGSLWYLYEYTHEKKWKDAAHQWTMAVEKEKTNTTTHDLGFMLYCSFGNGYRLAKEDQYKTIMLEGAKSLTTRFNPVTGCIKSWDKFKSWNKQDPEYTYPVIIDNMMNLEFLFWATKASGDSSFYKTAVTHANTTLKNHFRPDNSSYHVICYDETNGNVLAKRTAQGHADESSWARGQAWGLYGYTTMFRDTKQKSYLEQAQKIADFILNHPRLPSDKIPYWDFDAPEIPDAKRDASAGAIIASALLELSQYSSKEKAGTYFKSAEQMLRSLASDAYTAKPGENGNFLIKHCTGHKPAGTEIDVPLVYADYYYLEALLRYDEQLKKQKKTKKG